MTPFGRRSPSGSLVDSPMAPIPKVSIAQLPCVGLEARDLRSDPCAAYEAAKQAIYGTIREGKTGFDFSGYAFTELPEEIAQLYELNVSFGFRGCERLTKLPTGFRALSALRPEPDVQASSGRSDLGIPCFAATRAQVKMLLRLTGLSSGWGAAACHTDLGGNQLRAGRPAGDVCRADVSKRSQTDVR